MTEPSRPREAEGELWYMSKTRDGGFRAQYQGKMIFTNLTQQNHSDAGLKAVSRGALAAEDLRRRQQKRSPKGASGGDV